MKLIVSLFLIMILGLGCKKPEDSKTRTFYFTSTNGKTYSTNYVNTAIPVKTGPSHSYIMKVAQRGQNGFFSC